MKITRRQLRHLINEAMYDPMHGMKSIEDPGEYAQIMKVIDDPEIPEEYVKQMYYIGDSISDYEDPRPNMSDDSLAGVKRQNREHAEAAINSYLPGFFNLDESIISAVIEFVFYSKNPQLYIVINHDELDNDMSGEKPSVDDLYDRPKDYDSKFYYVYAPATSSPNPFAKLDPYLDPNSQYSMHHSGNPQTGFGEGFVDKYQAVSTDPFHRKSAVAVEASFIDMIRELRPDHEEHVV